MTHCLDLIHAGEEEKALLSFEAMPREEKLAFLKSLHSLVSPPTMVSILTRKLKNGHTYNDFHEAWLPPDDYTHPTTNSLGYFDVPVRVLNCVRMDDPSEILSIGLMGVPPEELSNKYKTYDKPEKIRHDNIEKVADKIGPSLMYVLKDSINLGP